MTIFLVAHHGFGAVKIMHADVFGFINGGQTSGASGRHQIPRHLGLAVGSHDFATRELFNINPMAFATKDQLNTVVDNAFSADPSAHAGLVQHRNGGLLQNAGTNAPQHVLGALAFDDDGVNTCFMKQLTEQQPRRTSAYDGDLGAL